MDLTDREKVEAVELLIEAAHRVTPAKRAIVYVADVERALGRDVPVPNKNVGT